MMEQEVTIKETLRGKVTPKRAYDKAEEMILENGFTAVTSIAVYFEHFEMAELGGGVQRINQGADVVVEGFRNVEPIDEEDDE
jgi:hypothetical protein